MIRVFVLERTHAYRLSGEDGRLRYWPVECYTTRKACIREAERRNQKAKHWRYRCRPTSLQIKD